VLCFSSTFPLDVVLMDCFHYRARCLIFQSAEVKKEDQNNNRQFGPRQMIYSPPEMRLGQALDTRAKRLGKAVSVVNYQRSLSPKRVIMRHHP
jgi:hypothetical protein